MEAVAEEDAADVAEAVGFVAHDEDVVWWLRTLAPEAGALEDLVNVAGGLLGGVDEGDAAPHELAEEWAEERVVGAPEDEDVDVDLPDRAEVLLRDEAGGRMVEPPLLDERDE